MATGRGRNTAASRHEAAPKTRATQQSKDADELRQLIQDVIDAKQRGDDAAREEAIDALIAFRTRPVSPELRQAAAEARAAADHDVMVDSLRLLGEIATRMKSAATGLDSGTALATSGAKALLFPRLATSAENMLQAVLELQQATEEVKGQLENAEELGDIPKVLDSVRAALEKLKARAKTLQP